MSRVFVVDISPTTSASGATTRFLFSTQAFATRPTDTPANTPVRALLKNAGTVRRELFSGARVTGAITPSYGNIVLANPAPVEDAAGELDDWIGYGISGAQVIVRWGEIGAAYPTEWTTVYIAFAHSIVADLEDITIRLRDRLQLLYQPVITSSFAATGGLEGSEALNMRKQVMINNDVFFPPILINAQKLIYFVHASGVGDTWKWAHGNYHTVFDRGIRLEYDGRYDTEAQLLDDAQAPAAGYSKWYFGRSSFYDSTLRNGPVYFRLGSPPDGDLRVTSRGFPNDFDRLRNGGPTDRFVMGTLVMRAGVAKGDIVNDGFGELIPRFVDDDATYLDVMNDAATARNGWFGFTRLDKFHSGLLGDPSEANVTYTFNGSEVKNLRREPPAGMEVPIWKVTFEAGKTYPSDVADGAPDRYRDHLTRTPSYVSGQGVSTLTITANPGAATAAVKIHGWPFKKIPEVREAAERYFYLYGARRDFWTFSVPMSDEVLALELHDVVELVSPRFNLSAGFRQRIVGITIDCSAAVPQIKFVLWGGYMGLMTGFEGGPGYAGWPGRVLPTTPTTPTLAQQLASSIGDFTGWMFGTVSTAATTAAVGSPIGDFTGRMVGTVTGDPDFSGVVLLLQPTLETSTTSTPDNFNTTGLDPDVVVSNGDKDFFIPNNGTVTTTQVFQAFRERRSGRYYWEVLHVSTGNSFVCGFTATSGADGAITLNVTSGSVSGSSFGGGSQTVNTGFTASTGTIYQFAIDFGRCLVWVGKDGTWYNSGDPETATNATLAMTQIASGMPLITARGDFASGADGGLRLSAADCTYSVPTGFAAWSSDDTDDHDFDSSVVDFSGSPKTVAFVGNVGAQDDVTPFAGMAAFEIPNARGSGGGSQGIVITANAEFNFGSAAFSIEVGGYRRSNAFTGTLYRFLVANVAFSLVVNTSGEVILNYKSSGGTQANIATGVTFPLNQWNWVVVRRNAGNFEFALNGSLEVTTAITGGAGSTVDASPYDVYFGADGLTGSTTWDGYVTMGRVTAGVLRSFDVPSAPYPTL